MIRLKDIPVFVKLDPEHLVRTNLSQELQIDIHRINRDLTQQPARYMWWAALYCECAAKVNLLKEKLDFLQGDLAGNVRAKREAKPTEVKAEVSRNSLVRALKQRIRHWENHERFLKHALTAFEQRKDVLQSYSANRRQEMDATPRTKKDREE
jgi:hypothetical protein